jgi:hypothetical protein
MGELEFHRYRHLTARDRQALNLGRVAGPAERRQGSV